MDGLNGLLGRLVLNHAMLDTRLGRGSAATQRSPAQDVTTRFSRVWERMIDVRDCPTLDTVSIGSYRCDNGHNDHT